jgi:cobalt/nickel transport system permease protein
MHMADALISPAVGGAMLAVTGGLTVHCARKIRTETDDHKVPLMGILGAFVFSAQMINFSIPGTGSSGHLGGGMLLAILLGPHAAFLTIASVLLVQALFFADGGLLAFGCNVVNLGLFPCFIAYPLIYRVLAGDGAGKGRSMTAAIAASVVGLQLGALAVVLQTTLSGISDLPLGKFLLFMLPMHLAIGLVEGVVTGGVVSFVRTARPEFFQSDLAARPARSMSPRSLAAALLVVAVVTGGFLSWFASEHPDGLEWSIARSAGSEEVSSGEGRLHALSGTLQEKTAFLPDYGIKGTGDEAADAKSAAAERAGTSVSGLIGAAITLCLVAAFGFGLK